MFCSPKKIAENQSNQSPIYQSRLHLDCTNGGNPRAIEWNATELHQLWERCNLGSIWPIDGQSIQNWGFQLWFAINPNLTADRHVWALTRGQVQTVAWGSLAILSVPHNPQYTLSRVVAILMQSMISPFAIHPITSQFRLFAILLQFRQIALQLNPDPKMSTRFQAALMMPRRLLRIREQPLQCWSNLLQSRGLMKDCAVPRNPWTILQSMRNSFNFSNLTTNQVILRQLHKTSQFWENCMSSARHNCTFRPQSWDANPQLTQSTWIVSGLQFLKGLQVNWKNCIKIVWIADRTQKQPLSQRNRSIFEPIHEFNCNPCQFCKFKGQSQNTVFFCNSFQFMNFNANQSIPMQFHGALQNLPQSPQDANPRHNRYN